MPFRKWFVSRIFDFFQLRNMAAASKERIKESRTMRRSRAEAALWVTRLHGPNRNRDMETGFRSWLTESPDRAAAFEAATDTYEWLTSISDGRIRSGR